MIILYIYNETFFFNIIFVNCGLVFLFLTFSILWKFYSLIKQQQQQQTFFSFSVKKKQI